MKRVLLCLLVVSGLAVPLQAEEPAQPSADEASIRKTVAAYVQAYNKHDASAVANLWSPEAVYINRLTGEEAVGRAAIAEQFVALFKEQPELKLEVNPESIRLLSPNVAVEHGTARLLAPKGEPEELKYTAIYVKREGQWLLDRVTDGTETEPPSHYEQLKVLEWMVGTWVDQDGQRPHRNRVQLDQESQLPHAVVLDFRRGSH